MTNVGELIEELKDIDPERKVVVAAGAMGSKASPLIAWQKVIYMPDDTPWSGETQIEGPLTDELRAQGYSEEDVRMKEDGHLRALVLRPMN